MFINWITKKLSQPDIEKLCKEAATTPEERVLIVHSDDMAYDFYFPNRTKCNVEQVDEEVKIIAEKNYEQIPVDDSSYDAIVCTGLLEHVPEPLKTLTEFNRIIKPGGKVIISASYAFSTHNAPENYFHFSIYGMKYLLEQAGFVVEVSRASCRPFRTIGILLQRIGYQTDMSPFVKVPLFLVAKIMPGFDIFIRQDYGGINRDIKMDSSLYSNVQAVGVKK